jgi:hypothetical protein
MSSRTASHVRVVLEALKQKGSPGDGSTQRTSPAMADVAGATAGVGAAGDFKTPKPDSAVGAAVGLGAGVASSGPNAKAAASATSAASAPASKATADYAAELAAVKALAGALVTYPQTSKITTEKTNVGAKLASAVANAAKSEWSAAMADLADARAKCVAAKEQADGLVPTAAAPTVAVVQTQAGELSGGQWVARFPGSAEVEECRDPFKSSLTRFVSALRAAGANVTISATFRPVERAYLMHWS